MSVGQQSRLLSAIFKSFGITGESAWGNQEPIREEIFSAERLEEHARSLAGMQPIATRPVRRQPLTSRLSENETALRDAFRSTISAAEAGKAITPAAEWLSDNYHIVERQIAEVRADLPPGYYKQLPKLVSGPFTGYPRVLGLIWAYVAHTDSRFDADLLERYVRAYQEVQPLTIGELWAVAITLRIVLIENLRRIAVLIEQSQKSREESDELATRLLDLSERGPKKVEQILADLPFGPVADAFAVQFVHMLRDQSPSVMPAVTWLEERLAERGTTVDAAIQMEQERQVGATVTVRNIITSMRTISQIDWQVLFERISLVDDVLVTGGLYTQMSFATRNLYRTAIEELARSSPISEIQVAARAVSATAQYHSAEVAKDMRRGDSGYYLFGAGRPGFEAEIGYRPPVRVWSQRLSRAMGLPGYGASILILAALILLIPLLIVSAKGLGLAWLSVLATLGVVPALDAAVGLINASVTRTVRATFLPALELRGGVPPELRTLVVVPVMLTSHESIIEQIEELEIHHLASLEGDVHFALLSDWADAATEFVGGDDELLEVAAEGIARLNSEYPTMAGGDRFVLLHRRRVWNESEQRWIGWERKRGKLHELNRVLRGATDTTFIAVGGRPPAAPAGIRYVITLDADTKLPRDTVRRLIGKMAHPLNQPRFDPQLGRVVDGYSILQPRVSASLPTKNEGTRFQQIFSSASGIDPYAAAVSDVYQDLFGEGSYAGKGIYHVDTFEAALAGRVPDSTMLSHDLFEGIFARAGLASDVEVVEEYPARYDVAMRRHHRWARGDWQLLPWILGLRRVNRPIPVIGRAKMLDNLRRSLTAPTSVLALFAGWTARPDAALVWTAFVLVVLAVPAAIPLADTVLHRPTGSTLRSRLSAIGGDLRMALARWVLLIALLADQAWQMSDAIVRTLVRLTITRRNLLQWVTAANLASGPEPGFGDFYRRMAGAIVVGVSGIGLAWYAHSGTLPLALSFGFLWIASPGIAAFISAAPKPPSRLFVAPRNEQELRCIARQTWRYFEAFVTSEDNMLPPDNFQEDPKPVVAQRTSPTNIGMYLLSIVGARDFGWIGTIEAVERIEATMATLGRLERFRGHFYNWYDTHDLRVLDPPYVSSVDSGNLAGHLIVVASACREWAAARAHGSARLAGSTDSLLLARKAAATLHSRAGATSGALRSVDAALDEFAKHLHAVSVAGHLDDAELAHLAATAEKIVHDTGGLSIESGDDGTAELHSWAEAAQATILSHGRDVAHEPDFDVLSRRLHSLADLTRAMALEMEFGFLLDDDRKLLSIGYLVSEAKLDANCYDLLASEARLASFLAIAKGEVPARHWFQLGHAVTPAGGGPALISWSGSMFEYLMPTLIMSAPVDSLLERTERRIVQRQIEYGRQQDIPWGISESAFNARDLEFTFQYSNFGVPGLGLKRGLGENKVIAPYATALAAMIEPQAALHNFNRLADAGGRGRFGFYEALDYTASRVPVGQSVAVVHSFMAHHQGMTIVALANALLGGIMRDRFHADTLVKAAELLLQERMPRQIAVTFPLVEEEGKIASRVKEIEPPAGRRYSNADSASPATHMLSNGRYSVMLTTAGSGQTRWRDLAVTRWRADTTCDDWGSYVFLRDVNNGNVWSAGFQPTGKEPDTYTVVFNEDRAEYSRRDGGLTTGMTVLVSAEDDSEVRRIAISNGGRTMREVEVTSYVELALAPQLADVAHPAFLKLFVETERLPGSDALLAGRRRRGPDEQEVWAAHLVTVEGKMVGNLEFETDRARFLGRGSASRIPRPIIEGRSLTGSTGTVLDPIFALRARVQIAPGASVHLNYWTMVGSSRESVLDLVDKNQTTIAYERAAALAWTQAHVQLHHLGLSPGDAGQFQRLAGHLLYASPSLRPPAEAIAEGTGPQSDLWSLGISGDLPIIVLRVADIEHLGIVRELVQAAEYWRMKRLVFDLVILNERGSSYIQELQDALEAIVRASQGRNQFGERPNGGIFVVRADLVPARTRALLLSVAHAILAGQYGRLSEQLDSRRGTRVPKLRPRPRPRPASLSAPVLARPPGLEYFNGLGGFANDGREYVIILGPGQNTPAPWINVIANPKFGFQVSEEGAGYAWAQNSREHQLTPWFNDPVRNPPGQTFFVRDEETQDLWSPTASPIRDEDGVYVARHGQGYSQFEHSASGLDLSLLEYVPLNDPVKISRLTIRNTSGRPRHLSVTAYVEWVLGPSRRVSAIHTTTAIDARTKAMFARNQWNGDFGARVAFLDLGGRHTSWTGNRTEFIGRNGAISNPAALSGPVPLSNWVGAGVDPCGVLQTSFELAPGASIEVVTLLGEGASGDEAGLLIERYRAADLDGVLNEVKSFWDDLVGAVQVKTPDRSLDIMVNGWLLYQTLACRMWARSGLYQASGAYGFRDQLQDGMALAVSSPSIAREHLVRAAGRQFVEGDVQHWWLPHNGIGVRTRISDDRVWLAFATAHYVTITGDLAVLDEQITFLGGPILAANEHEKFFVPGKSGLSVSLYEHCARALEASLAVGGHGVPLFGGGDWNDGFNRVGEGGKGESVWLGWFLHLALTKFIPLAEARNDKPRASAWKAHTEALRIALDAQAWDGEWYKRGWFDDGTSLGSSANAECRIDSIAQSWAVISGAGDSEHVARAMAAVERELINPETGLAMLFAPPFDRTTLEPGYIKGYPPGVRENGGQYTHAALWSVIAFAMLGEGDKAASLLAMLNPINHSRTRSEAHRYKLEPYAVAADIYSTAPHVGRGGWSWYTGAASWMYRASVEHVLGLRIEGEYFHFSPCIPRRWRSFEITLKHGASRYEFSVENPDSVATGIASIEYDGVEVDERPIRLPMKDDGRTHEIRVTLGAETNSAPR